MVRWKHLLHLYWRWFEIKVDLIEYEDNVIRHYIKLPRTFVQPTAWRKNRDYVLYYHNWSWTVVTGEVLFLYDWLFISIPQLVWPTSIVLWKICKGMSQTPITLPCLFTHWLMLMLRIDWYDSGWLGWFAVTHCYWIIF